MAKRSIGHTNKTKGSNAERYYAKVFQDLGFDKCVTSRYGSRVHDDAAIDLINVPFNVQIKAGKQKGLNPVSVLSDIKERIKEKFPINYPEHNYPNIFWNRGRHDFSFNSFG
jgi:uncharacterized protein YmfQ (DUF2313 family)